MKIGVLGIGHAGSKIAAEFARLGHAAAAINTSEADLDAVKAQLPARLHLYGPDGAAKDPQAGLDAVERNGDRIVEFLRNHFGRPDAGIKAILIAYSLGGGTGSGAGPAITEMAAGLFPEIPVCACPILPAEESAVIQYNAVESFAVLSRIRHMGATLIVDNRQAARLFEESVDRAELYDAVNRAVAGLVDQVLRVPEWSSNIANVDEQEILALLGTRGAMVIGRAFLPEQLDKVTVGNVIRDSWERSIFAATDYRAIRAAGIWTAPVETTKHLEWAEVFAPHPVPAELHEGIYPAAAGEVLTVLAGLPWPGERLREMEDRIESEREEFCAAAEAAAGQVFEARVRPLYDRPLRMGAGRPEGMPPAAGVSLADIVGRQRRR